MDARDWDLRAQEAYHQGDWEAAARAFAEAEQGYLAQGDLLAAAQARNNRMAMLIALNRPKEALALAEGLADIFHQAGALYAEALVWGNRAQALERLNRQREAEAAYHHSRELLEAHGQDHPQDLAAVYRGLARTASKQGRLRDALQWMWKATLLHPRTGLDRFLYYMARLGLRLFTG